MNCPICGIQYDIETLVEHHLPFIHNFNEDIEKINDRLTIVGYSDIITQYKIVKRQKNDKKC